MASDVLSKDADSFGRDPAAPSLSTRELLQKILAPLASLKLTVALMALGILLVLFGTLAQQYMNEFEAMKRFFRTWYTFVEIRSFFPKNFFPNLFFDKQPQIDAHWGFIFPGGFTIGSLMALNLLAAHGLRFKPQASGLRLWSGLAVIVIGVAVTYFVIVAGPDKEGFEASTKVHWANIHWYIKAALVGLIGACVAPLLKWQERGRWERIALAMAAVLLTGVTGFLLYRGDETVVQPEGLRILWQLLKGAFAGTVLLTGCILVFRKRAGVTLLHAGVLLMMSNELIVYNWHAENLLHANVGETVNFVMRPRSPELAIIDTSNPKVDDVTAIPASRLEKGKTLSDKTLPFDIELVDWMRNSTPIDLPPHMPNPATAGHGLRLTVVSEAPASGAGGGDKEDMPAAFIRLKSKPDGKDLGTYLVSYWFDPRMSAVDEQMSLDEGQPVEVDGKPYQFSLRPTRTYKPYALHLDDARESKYVGTNTAKSYESDAKLIDDNGNSRDVHIWMNNPVRYAGETFYQSSFGQDPQTGVKFSIFQVVANVGWMVPYVACMIVAVGMLAHFSLTLVRFLRRMDKQDGTAEDKIFVRGPIGVLMVLSGIIGRNAKQNDREDNDDDPLLRSVNIVLPLAAVLIPAIMLVSMDRTPQEIDTAFHYWDCADLPVAYEGRVKPWDSLARNSLRFISNKETFKDNADHKQPAIRWLLDMVARPEEADKYAVFRIEHDDVLNIFGLEQRDGLRYSIDDLRKNPGDFEKQVKKIGKMPPEQQGEFERKVLELDQRIKLYLTLRDAFRLPPEGNETSLEQAAYLVDAANMMNPQERPHLVTAPRAVPTSSATQPWEVAAFTNAQVWLQRQATALGETTPAGFAQHLINDIRKSDLDSLVRSKMRIYIEGIVRERMPKASEQDARTLAAKYLAELPEEMRAMAEKQAREEIDQSLTQMQANLEAAVRKVLGESRLDVAPTGPAAAVHDLLTAYRDGEVSQFNTAITAEKKELAAAPPVEYQPDKDEFERFFNYVAPFSTARWLYLIAFVLVAIGWLGWLKPFNRAAFCLILFTFLIHTFAIVGRIYISGRPPVTNLYSSAVFIGWAGVLLGIILETLYGLSYGNVIAAVIGHATLAIAEHLALEGETFIVMQAVLDTQFWLATHVSCVTLGYTTTYVAGLLGLVYLLMGMFTPALTEKHGKLLARMIYGTTCFSIFFSFVGTVLGGLWADDSWGRFWGWDPKENGALIIVLWNALVLHARWDGLVKDRGLAVLALVGNIVTSWSWFGVNQLGLGRHSYGFTREVVDALTYLVLSHLALIFLASLKQSWWWSVRAQKAAALAGKEKRGKRLV